MNKQRLGICFGPASGLSIGQLIPLAQGAEAAGFGSIWTGEFGNDCLAWAQALAAATQSCRVGSSIVNVYLRHPVVVAAAAAAIDELSQARFILGLGTSHRPIVEESLGLAMERPLEYLEEYAQIVRAVLAGSRVFHQGTFFKVQGYQLEAQPSTTELPIFVAVLGLSAAEKAARYADGVLLTLTPPNYEAELARRLRHSASLAGRDPAAIKVLQILPCFLADDSEAAEKAARRMICRYTALPFYGNMFAKAGFEREVTTIRAALSGDKPDRAAEAISQSMLEALAAVGDFNACRKAVERHQEAGADSVILYPNAVTSETSQAWQEAITFMIENRKGGV